MGCILVYTHTFFTYLRSFCNFFMLFIPASSFWSRGFALTVSFFAFIFSSLLEQTVKWTVPSAVPFLYLLNHVQILRWLLPNCSGPWGRVHPEQVVSPSLHFWHARSIKELDLKQRACLFTVGGKPNEHPHIHSWNMKPPHRKAPARIWTCDFLAVRY